MINKYDKAKIFKLAGEKLEAVFIGCTTLSLGQKLSEMKYNFGKDKSCSKYKEAFSLHGLGDIRIILIEHCPCSSMEELRAREYTIAKMELGNELDAKCGALLQPPKATEESADAVLLSKIAKLKELVKLLSALYYSILYCIVLYYIILYIPCLLRLSTQTAIRSCAGY